MYIESPNTSITTELNLSEGSPMIAIHSNGTAVIEQSPLGLRTSDESFVDDLSYERRDRRTVETKYETPAGKQRTHHVLANEGTVTITNNSGSAIYLDLRVSDDGVAYRYRLPGRGPVIITSEESAFRLPKDAPAWVMPFEKKHENIWESSSTVDSDGQYSFPPLFEVDDRWVLITEAGVDGRYAASRLETIRGDPIFRVRFPDSERHRMSTEPEDISTTRPLATPWRVCIVGNLSTVVESNLVTDVIDTPTYGNDPCEITDTSWIKPGRVAWSWWSDGSSPSDYETQREYVNYASERGWEYVLIDDGWMSEWLPVLVNYADKRDVDVLLWSRWSDLDTPAKREIRLARWKAWGVAGIKVDFMNSDTQSMMQFYDELAEATADHELLLNVHGSITPKGLRRRWPHLLTYEGVFGAENYHPFPKTIPPTHNLILPFTRNVVGPMDYTPVTFSAETRTTTVGHELALSVVYETGLQHFADSIESYAGRPYAETFLEEVPAVWDETRFVGGYPGEEAVFARRRNDQWFIGAISAGEPKTIDVGGEFLRDEMDYRIELFQDDDDGESIVYHKSTMTSIDDVSVEVSENGGFAAIVRPQDGTGFDR